MAKYLVCFLYFFVALQLVHGAVFQCENEEIDINCPFGEAINITNAFYGRNNNTICSKGNVTEPKCSLVNATFIVAEKCNNKQSCSISVNSTVFGDSCAGTTTYLEVNFTCDSSLKCGKHEHAERGVCNCKGFCKNNVTCLPLCPYENKCVCNDGYLRDTISQQCVLAEYCPIKGDPKRNHEEFCECASRQRTCRHPWAFLYFHYSCQPGYACKDGYLRDPYTNTCVLPGECPRPYPRWK